MQVRKSYEEKRRRSKAGGRARPWKLKRMAVDSAGDDPTVKGRGRHGAAAGLSQDEADRERFLEVPLKRDSDKLEHDAYANSVNADTPV